MNPLVLFVSMVLPVPVGTPIPCLICQATTASSTTTFSGTVAGIDSAGLRVFDFTSRRVMAFIVPADFHAVDSGDGVIKSAPLARAKPGLYARVTYTSARGLNTAVKVLLLTGDQCRSLLAAERSTDPKTQCPD